MLSPSGDELKRDFNFAIKIELEILNLCFEFPFCHVAFLNGVLTNYGFFSSWDTFVLCFSSFHFLALPVTVVTFPLIQKEIRLKDVSKCICADWRK